MQPPRQHDHHCWTRFFRHIFIKRARRYSQGFYLRYEMRRFLNVYDQLTED
jgi:hypothetical protein